MHLMAFPGHATTAYGGSASPTPACPVHHPNAHRHEVQADGADLTLQPPRRRVREGMRQRVLQAAVARVARQTLLQRAQHVAHLRG